MASKNYSDYVKLISINALTYAPCLYRWPYLSHVAKFLEFILNTRFPGYFIQFNVYSGIPSNVKKCMGQNGDALKGIRE